MEPAVVDIREWQTETGSDGVEPSVGWHGHVALRREMEEASGSTAR